MSCYWRLRLSKACHCSAVGNGLSCPQKSGSLETFRIHSVTTSVHARACKTRKKGETKSASTPSIPSPTIIVVTNLSESATTVNHVLVSTEPNMLTKNFE